MPGPIQTTPRAELYAILLAVVHGASPQTIVCDHWNHVLKLRELADGCTSILNPKTPNLDLGRLVYHAIKCRGGLKSEGPDMLWGIWQPSHTRAHTGETTEQQNLRRGNDAADTWAGKGRAGSQTRLTLGTR